MKKYLLLVLAASIVLASCNKKKEPENYFGTESWLNNEETPPQEIPVEPSYYYVNTLDGVNVRDIPGGNKIARLPFDEKVRFLENGKYEEIDGYHKNWIKIRTDAGSEGYVYGAYLSETIEDAQKFRRNEQLGKAFSWLENYEDIFRRKGIDIDTSPYNIGNNEELYHLYPDQENSIEFLFYSTFDKEKDTPGNFLYMVQLYNDDEYYPDFLPFKIGDPVEEVYRYFGPQNASQFRSNGPWWCDNCSICMKVETENDRIVKVIITKCGW